MSALPPDGHVHTQFSWDTHRGDLLATCARAVEVGLPGVVFTDHLDATPWTPGALDLEGNPNVAARTGEDGLLRPPPLDVEGYHETVDRARARFPDLTILTGAEFGEPHRNLGAVRDLLAVRPLDRVLGSLHSLEHDGAWFEPAGLYERLPADVVMREYLAELARMISASDAFDVLTHIDYPVRAWPVQAGPFDPRRFEEEYRHALRLLAESGRALEYNTRLPLDPTILRWWREEGGTAVAFGSDTHEPALVGNGFADAAASAAEAGFGPGSTPADLWRASVV